MLTLGQLQELLPPTSPLSALPTSGATQPAPLQLQDCHKSQPCYKGKLKSRLVYVGALGCEPWQFSRTPKRGKVNEARTSPCLLL